MYNNIFAQCKDVTIKGMSISMATLICSCSDFANVPMIVNEMIWARCLTGCLMQLVSNMKVQSLSPQLVCNQGNHSVVKTANQILLWINYCGPAANSITLNTCTDV